MKYFKKTFIFVKPFLAQYIAGIVLYSSQGFLFSFISSLMVSLLSAAIISGNITGVYISTAIYIGVYLVVMGFIAFGTYSYVIAGTKATRALKARLFKSFVTGSLEASVATHSGEGIAAINTDADTASNALTNALSPFLQCLISIVPSLAVVIVVDYRLGLASALVGGLAFLIQSRFAKPLGKLSQERLEANSASVKSMSNIFSGGLTIRAFSLQTRALMAFDAENDRLRRLSFKQAFISMWQDMFTTIQGWLTLCMTFAFGGWLVATGRLSFPMLMMVPNMCMQIAYGISGIGATWAGLQPSIAAAERVFKIIERGTGTESEGGSGVEPGESGSDDGAGVGTAVGTVVGSTVGSTVLSGQSECKNEIESEFGGNCQTDYNISISGLNFKYSGSDKNALSDVNLHIGNNEMVAFVGSSGSGKSTLLRVISGMYEMPRLIRDNREGSDMDITMNGKSFSDFTPVSWRSLFAIVDQSCKLFDMTVAENIALGAVGVSGAAGTTISVTGATAATGASGAQGAADSAADSAGASDTLADLVRESAIRASADEFISNLPDGYDSPCGEKGASLSGGQKQRIAIARALYRKSPVLVFDEATSALDAESERNIMDTIENLRKDHTVLITTHNLHNTISADRIVVMDNGRIVETGTHDELLRKAGVYAQLYHR